MCIYVKTWMDLRCSDVHIIWDSVCSPKLAQTEVRSKCDYTTGNISDVDYNAYYEAEGPFVCIYVKIRTNLC